MQEKVEKAIALLSQLIETQSFSSEEDQTALLIESFLKSHGVDFKRQNNNIIAYNKFASDDKPTILLNSHHDTVKPNKAYTRDPFKADIEDGKLYGLGSNDAGGCLVSLITTFIHFYLEEDMPYNLLLVASAEEESSGKLGLSSVLPILPKLDFAIVGEPTLLDLAIAEKGLLVLDVEVVGTPGHAAHIYEDQAMHHAMDVVNWFKNYEFEKVSETLGKVKMTVTQIQAGSQHNVVPAKVNMVVDVRINDCYSNKEVLEIIQSNLKAKVQPRSLHLNSSRIDKNHAIVQTGIALGKATYGSPTLSDQTWLSCESLKLGPGDSKRSHSADEFIYLKEIEEGIALYIALLSELLIKKN